MKKYLTLFLSLLILGSCNNRHSTIDGEKPNAKGTPAYSDQDHVVEADSLVLILPTLPDDTNKVKVYQKVIELYNRYGVPSKALPHITPGIDLAKELNFRIVPLLEASGRTYWKLGQNDMALKYHSEALGLTDEKKQPKAYVKILCFIGQDYGDAGNYSEALKYFFKAKDMYSTLGDLFGQANIVNLISWVYTQEGNFAECERYNMEALHLYELLGDKNGQAVTLANLAESCREMEKYDQAIYYFKQAFVLSTGSNDVVNFAGAHLGLAKVYLKQNSYELALQEIDKAYEMCRKVEDFNMMGECFEMKGNLERRRLNYSGAAENFLLALDLFKKANSLHEIIRAYSYLTICYVRLNKKELAKASMDSTEVYTGRLKTKALMVDYYNSKQLYDSLTGNWKSAYQNFNSYIDLNDSIRNSDVSKKILQHLVQYEFDKKEEAARVEQEKKDIKQRNIRNIIAILFGTALIFLAVVSQQRNKISKARKRSDELLLNILPEETAEELKVKGSVDAKQFDLVTVMFTDFKGFTNIAEKLTPAELVNVIHGFFMEFDKITSRYGIEKIKTIGDAYMCAGGLPVENTSNPEDVVKAALEIQQFMQQHFDERTKSGQEVFEIRIGVHTGPVVAGIVGIKKFAYDIWGDTVNIASRMESSGEAGKVNISGATYALVKDKFKCIYRGKIHAKNKGEIDMYFVEAIS